MQPERAARELQAVGAMPRSAPEQPPAVRWRVPGGAPAIRRNSSRNDHWAGYWSHSACTCVRAVSAAKIRIAAQRAASRLRSSGARAPAVEAAGQRWRAAQRMAGPPRAWQGRAVSTTVRRARVLAVASARRQPLRLKSGDSRSPDKTSATRGSLCRSGYTSPTIAQSLVPHFHYFKLGVE